MRESGQILVLSMTMMPDPFLLRRTSLWSCRRQSGVCWCRRPNELRSHLQHRNRSQNDSNGPIASFELYQSAATQGSEWCHRRQKHIRFILNVHIRCINVNRRRKLHHLTQRQLPTGSRNRQEASFRRCGSTSGQIINNASEIANCVRLVRGIFIGCVAPKTSQPRLVF